MSALSARTEKMASDGLITVGVLLSASAIYKLLSGKNGKKSSSITSRLMRIVKEQIGLYIMNECRKKIVEYINSLDEEQMDEEQA